MLINLEILRNVQAAKYDKNHAYISTTNYSTGRKTCVTRQTLGFFGTFQNKLTTRVRIDVVHSVLEEDCCLLEYEAVL